MGDRRRSRGPGRQPRGPGALRGESGARRAVTPYRPRNPWRQRRIDRRFDRPGYAPRPPPTLPLPPPAGASARDTGSARRMFFRNTGARRINAVSMWTPRAGNPPVPVPGGAARCPIRELEAESPQGPANEAATQGARHCRQPPVFHKKRQSHTHGRPCGPRSILEHPIHAVSGHTGHTRGTPESTPRIHVRRPTSPEKSPICKCRAEFPAIKMMHGVLRRLHKSPTVQSLARKKALLSPGSPTG